MALMQLTFLGGDFQGRSFIIGGEISIGRGDGNTLILKDSAISCDHCLIYPKGDRLFIRDLDSTNGTMVNSRPIQTTELYDEDMILVGNTQVAVNRIPDGTSGEVIGTPGIPSLGINKTTPPIELRRTAKIAALPEMSKSKRPAVRRTPGPTDRWRRRFL